MTDYEKLHFLHKMKVFKEKFTLKKIAICAKTL